MRFIILVLNVLWFSLGLTTVAHADPITTLLFGAAFAASTAGAIVSAGIAIAINIGASLLISALTPKPEQKKPTFSIPLSLQVGGDNPIAFPVGYTATAGMLVYPGTWGNVDGTPNAYAVWEIELSDLPTPDNPAIWVFEQKCTIDWNATPTTQGYPVTEFRRNGKDHLWVQFDDGTQTTPSSYMRGKFSGHSTRPYTSDMVGVGIAKVRVTALANRDLWTSSPGNSLLFETTGIPLYNIAKDTSVGGSGSHRWADPSTWEPSSNPIVIAYNIRRGIFYYPTPTSRTGAQWVYGGNNKRELSAYRLPASNWIAAINACDTLIDLSGGGTEKQFRAGAMVNGDMEPIDVIDQLLSSCNARMAEVGGIYKVQVGAPGAAVYSFTDEHVVITEGQSFDPFPGLEDTHNAIEATYPEPGEKWSTKDAPGRYNDDWEAEDGGRQLVADATYPMVPYRYQVQRLMVAAINDARRFRNHGITLPPDAWLLEPNDVVAWTSVRNGYENKKFLVTSISGRRGYNQVVGLKEIDPADYDWDAATDEISVGIGDLVIERPAPQLMSGWQALPAIIVDNDDASRRPSIEVRFDGGLVDVRAVHVQVRLSGETGLAYDGEVPYEIDETSPARTLNGVFLPDTDYEVRGIYVPFSRRVTRWSNQDVDGTEGAWLGVTTGDIRLGPNDFYPIDTEGLADQVNDFFQWTAQSNAKLRDDIQSVVVRMQDQAGTNLDTFQQVRQSLTATAGNLKADYTNEITVVVGQVGAVSTRVETLEAAYNDPATGNAALASGLDAIMTQVNDEEAGLSALATAVTSVQASVDDVSAGGAARFEAAASPGGGYSRYGVAVFANGTAGYVQAGFYFDVNGTTGESRGVLAADEVVVASSGGTIAALFETGTTYLDNARIHNLDADNIDVEALTASSAFIANLQVDWANITNVNIDSADIGTATIQRLNLAPGAVTTIPNDSGSGSPQYNIDSGWQYVWGQPFEAPAGPFIAGGSCVTTNNGMGSHSEAIKMVLKRVSNGAITDIVPQISGTTQSGWWITGNLVKGQQYQLGWAASGTGDNVGYRWQFGAWKTSATVVGLV
ncbi:MAG TPA: phage tail protein [Pseudolabrys sp.]|nr:phage tail protein [Pseudolabrys sp.]